MGYEDGKVDQQKRKYGNARRPKVKLSKNYFKIHNDSNDYANKSKSNQKSSKKKNKVQKFKFSKYHALSINVLYHYELEECKQGLRADAIKQINRIQNLIGICENKSYLKCKIDEINEFIIYHKLNDSKIQKKLRKINDLFDKKFN